MERSISSYTDQEIVNGVKNNQSWAIQSLYQLDRNSIFNWVMNNTGDYEDAQDVLQEGVIAVCKNIVSEKYKPGAAQLKTYLNKVCRYWWYNELRRRKPNFQIPDGFEMEDVEVGEAEKNELVEVLSKYLDRLGDKCQSVLRLRFWEGKKMEEIAGILGNTLQVVKNRSSKCISELYEMYNNKL
jgi:RNA polymerase sigma factor (sigma-70 family)